MPPDLMTIPEVAELLRLAERTVYDMCRTGKLPGIAKIGGKWRIERQKLTAWIANGGEIATETKASTADEHGV